MANYATVSYVKRKIKEYVKERIEKELKKLSKDDYTISVKYPETDKALLNGLNASIIALNEKVASQGQVIDGLRDDIAKLQKDNAQLFASQSENFREIKDLNIRINSLEQEIIILKSREEVKVAQEPVVPVADTKSPVSTAPTEEVVIPPAPVEVSPEKIETVKKVVPLFADNQDDNVKAIDKIIVHTEDLRALLTKEGGSEIEIKLVVKCKERLEQLKIKQQTRELGADKLATETSKIFKQTIVKCLSQKANKPTIEAYMEACGLRKLGLKIGAVLTDDDYEYFGDGVFYEDVKKKELNNTIIGIIQDTYIVDYMDEDGLYEAIIPGFYNIGRFKA